MKTNYEALMLPELIFAQWDCVPTQVKAHLFFIATCSTSSGVEQRMDSNLGVKPETLML